MLKAYTPGVDLRFSTNRVNFGRTVTRNVGWQQSCADTIIFLDADSLPDPDWLARHDEAWKKEQFDVISGLRHHIHVAPDQNCMGNLLKLLVHVHADDLFIKDVPAQFQAIHRHAALGVYPEAESLDRQLPDICRVYPKNIICAYSFITANVAVRRTLLEQTAGFDPFTRRPDDTELGIRLWEAGARFGFADAKSYHLFARQLDRNIDVLEYLAFFYRHPYHTVLTMYLWGFYCLPRSPKHVLQNPDALTEIAKADGRVLDNI
jgi:glycosyltransferase involved in cell wall biosynthesis